MRICILGAGVIGVASAYYLNKLGFEVHVIDRHLGAGEGTSFANAGMISPSYAMPWPSPQVPAKLLQWLFSSRAPLAWEKIPNVELARWLLAAARNCTPQRFVRNRERMIALSVYSAEKLAELRQVTGIEFECNDKGTLQVFLSQKELDNAASQLGTLSQFGLSSSVLSSQECAVVEPGLRYSSASIVGGISLPQDSTGNCYLFTKKLADMLGKNGVIFHSNTEVNSIAIDGGRVVGVNTDHGHVFCDSALVAMGWETHKILRGHGLSLPIQPIKGYSLTSPITCLDRGPTSTVMHEELKVAITRLGASVRVGGLADFAGGNLKIREDRARQLKIALEELFPQCCEIENSEYWTGLRPMTPDGMPIVGGTHIKGLYVNSGHGTLGWTMACGTAAIVADCISGKQHRPDCSVY